MESTSNEDRLSFSRKRTGCTQRRCGLSLSGIRLSRSRAEAPWCWDDSLITPALLRKKGMTWLGDGHGELEAAGLWAGKQLDTVLSYPLCVSLGELTQDQLELLHWIHWLPLAGFLTLSAQLLNQEAFFVSDRKPLVFLWCWDQMQSLGLASPGELLFAFLLDAGSGWVTGI